MEAKLEKASFEIYEDNSNQPKETFKVLFNPSEYTISGGADYSKSKDVSGTKNKDTANAANYKGPKPLSLKVTLFFDTSGKRQFGKKGEAAQDVSKQTKKFHDMTRNVGELHTPPIVCFKWGSLNFRGKVMDVSTTYTMFSSGGMPVRAKVNLTMEAVSEKADTYMEPFESPDRTKARTITDDVQVWNIAQTEYGDPGMWRQICDANNISNPLEIPSGTVLKVPALD